jgi:hypothetical protein
MMMKQSRRKKIRKRRRIRKVKRKRIREMRVTRKKTKGENQSILLLSQQ